MSEQKSVKTLARLMGEMVATDGWKEYMKILAEQIATRERMIAAPLHDLQPAPIAARGQDTQVVFSAMDFTTRSVALECVKGALIGLKLARDMPSIIIADAKDSATPQPKEEN